MKLSSDDKKFLIQAARRAYPREACGVIAGGLTIELTNHSSGTREFRIRAEDLEAAAAKHRFRSIDGVWHSHPSGDVLPSEADLASHPWPAALVIVTRKTVAIYAEEDYRGS